MLVLLDPAKSAEPPQNSGKTAAIALITSPDAARVATSLPGAKTGISESHPAGKPRVRSLSNNAAFSLCAVFQAANFSFHC